MNTHKLSQRGLLKALSCGAWGCFVVVVVAGVIFEAVATATRSSPLRRSCRVPLSIQEQTTFRLSTLSI